MDYPHKGKVYGPGHGGLRSQIANASIAILNNKGKIGHPFLPRWSKKGGEQTPLVCTEANGEA